MLKGSVLSNKYRLIAARDFLLILKNRKLNIKEPVHINDPEWDFTLTVKHLTDEVREFMEAQDFHKRMEELADISNMVDIVAMEVLERWRRL